MTIFRLPATKVRHYLLATLTGILTGVIPLAQAELSEESRRILANMAPGAPAPVEGDFVHIPPTLDELQASALHPELKKVILRGHDIFTNTQQYRGQYVYNELNCDSCHLGAGRLPFSGPVWPAAVTLPDYRPKNDHVNNLEERIAGCFSYSMNGQPPAYGSDEMLALSSYIQWLAKGVPMYQPGASMYGRGYPRLADAAEQPDYHRGENIYQDRCSVCHGDDGAGLNTRGKVVFPALWGDESYNWGAGISRVFTLASFIRHNMPLGQPNTLSEQEAWDVAYYVNAQERPQDPRYTGDVKETRERYGETFHKHSLYGLEVGGRLLGDHDNVGNKDFLKPEALRSRSFD
ncbi:c-type cytochrome [Pseudomonas sp. MYb185]|uniref:c-type cytochrome n=1 Tax=Pseudomonas sp. MYb185 TaxID=1848729 RepID=UPI000CFD65F5|nr:c-type cytochrome [Pseudomonas sp. MYb185]PRB82908.1 cytochrome C [Pseudomonas sp. MYb185]